MGIFNCTLNLFLIPRFGAQGAALATVIGYNLISVGVNLTLAWMINREARLQEEAIGAINRSPSSYGE
jgi:O-antigen/teichoic acid export membrane protein